MTAKVIAFLCSIFSITIADQHIYVEVGDSYLLSPKIDPDFNQVTYSYFEKQGEKVSWRIIEYGFFNRSYTALPLKYELLTNFSLLLKNLQVKNSGYYVSEVYNYENYIVSTGWNIHVLAILTPPIVLINFTLNGTGCLMDVQCLTNYDQDHRINVVIDGYHYTHSVTDYLRFGESRNYTCSLTNYYREHRSREEFTCINPDKMKQSSTRTHLPIIFSFVAVAIIAVIVYLYIRKRDREKLIEYVYE